MEGVSSGSNLIGDTAIFFFCAFSVFVAWCVRVVCTVVLDMKLSPLEETYRPGRSISTGQVGRGGRVGTADDTQLVILSIFKAAPRRLGVLLFVLGVVECSCTRSGVAMVVLCWPNCIVAKRHGLS